MIGKSKGLKPYREQAGGASLRGTFLKIIRE
jgi:hypothetical protein